VVPIRPLVITLIAGGLASGCAPRAPVLPTPEPDPGSPELAWTVEVHSDADAVRADEVASEIRARFDEPVRVEKAGGSYHVRIGAFRTEKEAGDFLDIVREVMPGRIG